MEDNKKLGYYECDDPYKVLSAVIIGRYTLDAIKEFISNQDALVSKAKSNISDNIDIAGCFGDCAADVMNRKYKRDMDKLLDYIAEELVRHLDVARLQDELRNMVDELLGE